MKTSSAAAVAGAIISLCSSFAASAQSLPLLVGAPMPLIFAPKAFAVSKAEQALGIAGKVAGGQVRVARAWVASACVAEGRGQLSVPVTLMTELGKPGRTALKAAARMRYFTLVARKIDRMLEELGADPRGREIIAQGLGDRIVVTRTHDYVGGVGGALGLAAGHHEYTFDVTGPVVLSEGCAKGFDDRSYVEARKAYGNQIDKYQARQSSEGPSGHAFPRRYAPHLPQPI